MKRIFAILLPIVALSSCISGEFFKLQGGHFAEIEAKKLLYIPESYEAIETTVDSALLSAYNDPTILANASEIVDLNNRTLFLDKQSRQKIEKYTENIKSRLAELNEGEFFGWEIRHRFRAKDNDGRADILDMLFISDKGFNENLFTASLDVEEQGDYSEIIDCIDRVIADVDFENELEEFTNDLNEAINEVINEVKEIDFNEIAEEVEEATKEVKQEVKKAVEEVKKMDKDAIKESVQCATDTGKELAETAIYEATKIIEEATNEITSKHIEEPISKPSPSTPAKKKASQTSYSDDYFEYETNTNTIDSNTLLELNGL